jgi:hypothetical protein
MMIKGKNTLGWSWYTLAMLCHVAETWNGQGNDFVGWASGISMTSGSDVT